MWDAEDPIPILQDEETEAQTIDAACTGAYRGGPPLRPGWLNICALLLYGVSPAIVRMVRVQGKERL